MLNPLYIGIMSGTSLDGVDAVLASFPRTSHNDRVAVLNHVHRPFDPLLKSELLELNQPGFDEIHRMSLRAQDVAKAYAECVSELIAGADLPEGTNVQAIGAHGQTVRHRPELGYTVQLLNAAALAEATGIDVICDFRSRDVAAGGQGAPLVPAFHERVFRQPGEAVAVLNLGGIANVTAVEWGKAPLGFDCGPANALMDEWVQVHFGIPFDRDGHLAAGGQVLGPVLQAMLADPYFIASAPKSTGRDYFHRGWLTRQLAKHEISASWRAPLPARPAQDILATLAELTALTCADAVLHNAPLARSLLICGGGALNVHLMRRLQAQLPGVAVMTTAARGLPPMQVEATAFAWLAHAFREGLPGNVPRVTGARGPRILGALYPAGADAGRQLLRRGV